MDEITPILTFLSTMSAAKNPWAVFAGLLEGDTQQDNLLFIEGVSSESAAQAGLNSFLSEG